MHRFGPIVIAIATVTSCTSSTPVTTNTQQPRPKSQRIDNTGLPYEVKRFNNLLAPLWFAPAGGQRMRDTCVNVAQLQKRALAMGERPPDPAPQGWLTLVEGLISSIVDLGSSCQEGEAGFEARFKIVYKAFQRIANAAKR